MFKKILVILETIGLIGLLNACAIDPKEAYSQYQPRTLPIANVTRYTPALQCFDNLLARSNNKPISVYSEGVGNQADLPLSNTRNMLITTIANLHSNVFKFKDLPTASEYYSLPQGTTKTTPEFILKNGAIMQGNWKYADYKINYDFAPDKNIIVNSAGGVIVLESGDAGITHDDMVSVIALDMNITNMANNDVLSGITSSNTIAVFKQGTATDLGGKIKKAGFSFNFSADKSEGTEQAIKTLLQLSTIELLGKLAHVPYQQCLPKEDETPEQFASRLASAAVSTAAYTPTPQPIAHDAAKTTELGFKITPTKNRYQVKDVLAVQAEVLENAHVHCFYQDYRGKIWKIFPNQVQVSDYLPANTPMRIPAQNEAFEITLDKAKVSEQLMCLASREQLKTDFITSTVSESSTLAVASLSDVLDNYRQKNQGMLSRQTLLIQVQ